MTQGLKLMAGSYAIMTGFVLGTGLTGYPKIRRHCHSLRQTRPHDLQQTRTVHHERDKQPVSPMPAFHRGLHPGRT